MEAAPLSPARKLERAVGAALLALVLLYLLTERSRDVYFWRWSKGWCVAITAAAVCTAALLASYRRRLPRPVVALRSLAVVLSAATLAALVVAELALQLTQTEALTPLDNRGRHAFDPDVGHVYLPNFEQVIQEREFRTEWRSNAQGLRAERDYGAKPAGTRRILVVGDSFTVGDQVPYPQTYPARIESCLAGALSGAKIEVLDAGFPGYATVNEARWIAKFAAGFEPDLIIVGMTPNDLLENQFPLQYVARDGALVSGTASDADRRRWEDHRSWWSLPGRVERSLLRQRLESSPTWHRLKSGSAYTHHLAYMREPDAKAQRLFQLAEKHLLDARRAAQAAGARFALIVIPFREQLGALEPGLDGAAFPDHWKAFGAAQGIPVLDLLPDFRAAADPRSLYWREDAHCTSAGYALIGEATCRWLAADPAGFGL